DTNSQQTNHEDKKVNHNGDSENPDTNQGGSGDESGGDGIGVPGSSEGGSGSGSSSDSKVSGDQDVTHPSGKSTGGWLGNWGMSFDLTGYMPSVSSIYQSSNNILTNTANKITSAYNSAKAIAQDTYGTVVSTVKDAYDKTVSIAKDTYSATTNYIGNIVNSVTNQLSSFGTFQLSDDQSGFNSLGGGVDTSDPSQPKSPPPLQSLPSSPSPSITLPLSPSDPQNPSLSQSQDPSQIPSPSQLHSNQTQDQLQITVQNGASNTLQQSDSPTGTGGVQTPTITKSTLLSSSTGPSNTGNGSTNGNVVKMNEKKSIWYIGSNKKYDTMGIGIIFISTSIILAIMYKYISFGSAKNSKKKKSMKRVIKLADGNRKTQIIINSYDRSKHLKPVINSFGRKKDPLLNIYKLMQADPMPFINLFFLLIFFVYKRKLNYLEL
ncbi:hypothetical protein YYE_04944, partial [Plasmodium vinckei vinckei]